MPSARNLAHFPEIVGSWTRDKNPLSSLCQTSMISYCIPNLILITTDESSYHLSSKPVFTANGGHSRKPQLDIQNSTDGGEHSANRDSPTPATASVGKGHGTKGWKASQSRNTRMFVLTQFLQECLYWRKSPPFDIAVIGFVNLYI